MDRFLTFLDNLFGIIMQVFDRFYQGKLEHWCRNDNHSKVSLCEGQYMTAFGPCKFIIVYLSCTLNLKLTKFVIWWIYSKFSFKIYVTNSLDELMIWGTWIESCIWIKLEILNKDEWSWIKLCLENALTKRTWKWMNSLWMKFENNIGNWMNPCLNQIKLNYLANIWIQIKKSNDLSIICWFSKVLGFESHQ